MKGAEPSVALRSPVGHRATEDGTNEPCTHLLQSAEVYRLDVVLRSGLTRRTTPNK